MPRRDIDRLHDEIEELFAELWQVPRFLGQRRGFRPNVDSYRTADPPELTVVVELAGVEPASVHVVVDEDVPFLRQVRLPQGVDGEHAQAVFERGILRISLPVAKVPQPKGRVSIEVN